MAASPLPPQVGTNASASLKPLTMGYFLATGRQYSTYSMITTIIRALHQGMSQQLGAQLASQPQLAASVNPFFYIQPLQLVTIDLAPVERFGQSFSA
jgi:hypothetical protein